MNFYCDSGGTIFHVDPERIFQGSVGVNKIRFIGQFPSSAQVLVSYELPNGVITSPKVLTLVDELKELITIDSDRSFNVWETILCAVPRLDENGKVLKDVEGHIVYDYDYSLTENYGTVNVQFYVYGASKSITVNDQVYNVGNGMLATAKSSFKIERGVPAFVPPSAELLSPDSKVLIAEILNTVSSYATEINGAVDSANAIVKEVTEKLKNGDFIGAQGPKGDKGDAGSVKFVAVTELPTENIQYDAIYIVPIPGAEGEENRFTEYVYIDGKWEPLGAITIQVDHSEYVKFTDFATSEKAGVIMLSGSYAFGLTTSGTPRSDVINKDKYATSCPNLFISKGTLENIKYTYVKGGLVDSTEEWTDEDKATACETIGALPLSGGQLTGEIQLAQGDNNGINLGANGVINSGENTVLGFVYGNYCIGSYNIPTVIRTKGKKLMAQLGASSTAEAEALATEKYVNDIATENETWTFTLKDGTTVVTKQVAVKK